MHAEPDVVTRLVITGKGAAEITSPDAVSHIEMKRDTATFRKIRTAGRLRSRSLEEPPKSHLDLLDFIGFRIFEFPDGTTGNPKRAGTRRRRRVSREQS